MATGKPAETAREELATKSGDQLQATMQMQGGLLGNISSAVERISGATQEQARGNRQYLESVMEDNEKAHVLEQTATKQMWRAEEVYAFLQQAASLFW